jgi:hypothetical protein
VTAAQERRLLLAALDYAGADEVYREMKSRHIRLKRLPLCDGQVAARRERRNAAQVRARAKTRLLRAAGLFRAQPLLPLEAARDRATLSGAK